MSEWKKVRLGEMLNIRKGQPITKREACPGQYPVILGGQEPAYFIDKYNHVGKAIVISRSGASAGYVSFWDEPIFVTDGFLIEPKDCTSIEFLFYALKNRQGQLHNLQRGSAIPHVTPALLAEVETLLPPRAVQERIASILSNYDSAIANCRRQIVLLEEAAMRLYKEWFKDGEGRKVKLTDLVDVTYGYPFESRLFNEKKMGLPIVRIRNVPEGQSNDYTTEKAKETYIVHDGDLLIGMDGEFHMNFWSGGDAWLVQRTCRLLPKDIRQTGFVAEAIKEPIHAFQATIVGSTVGHLAKADIDTIGIMEPAKHIAKPLQVNFQTRLGLRLQIRTLSEARDRLLPKLMKGEIAV